jgi:outer membrane murein-binding lipoprotein Lpp
VPKRGGAIGEPFHLTEGKLDREIAMHWLRQSLAQRKVDRIDRRLADLRAKVSALPANKRAAFAKEIQGMVAEQARARNELSAALDDRHKR